MQPRVSIVIPTYNRLPYLRLALASAQAQTETDLEILVFDNAGEDETQAWVRGLRDPRIRYYRQPYNVGQFLNFKAACLSASGRYLVMLGDDDILPPDFIARLARPLDSDPDLILAFCDHEIIDADGRIQSEEARIVSRRFGRDRLSPGRHRPFAHLAIVDRAICTTSGALIRRAAIDWASFPEDIVLGFDLYTSYIAARSGQACWYEPERLMLYRHHAGAMSSSIVQPERVIQNCNDALRYWHRFASDPALGDERPYCRMKRGLNALKLVAALTRAGRPGDAFRQFTGFVRQGWIEPGIVIRHAFSAARLRRATG